MRRKPDFVIIGAQKAASTEIMRALDKHPDCFLEAEEQPFFRDPFFRTSLVDSFIETLTETEAARFGIKCPDYLGHPEVSARLREHLASPDLIVSLRDPVDRAVSAYYWYARWGLVPAVHANEGLRRVLDDDARLDPIAGEILTYGLYARHLRTYLHEFDPGSIHVVLHGDLKTDYAGVVRGLYRFLGLRDVATEPSSDDANPTIYSIPRLRFLQIPTSLVVERSADRRHAEIVRPRRPAAFLAYASVAATDRYLLSRILGNDRPVLDADVRDRLARYYAEDTAELALLIGRDLSGWASAVR